MKWIKQNIGWLATLISVILLVIGQTTGLFSFMLESGARSVYEKKAPCVEKMVDDKIQVHELKMEPRLQAIEYEVTEQRKVSVESLEIQKQTLEVLKELKDQ